VRDSRNGSSNGVETLSDIAAEVRREAWTWPRMAGPELRYNEDPGPAPARAAAAPAVVPAGEQLGAVIAEFLQDAQNGRARDYAGQPYTRESLRELRAALTHVDSELGDLSLDAVTGRHVQMLLDDVRDAGLAASRISSIVMALHSLYAYAIDRGLAAGSPLPGPVVPAPVAPAPVAPAPAIQDSRWDTPDTRWDTAASHWDTPDAPAPSSAQRTPTIELLAVARRVVGWTVTTIVVLFVLLLVVLIQQL
jgi:hypothetical protein